MSFNKSAELRDHALKYDGVDARSGASKYRIRSVSNLQHAREHVYNFSPPTSYGYATVEASIFGKDLTPCLDTGGGVFSYDRSLLPQYEDHYGIVHNTKPITVTGIAGKHVLNQYIEVQALLDPNRVPVQVEAYLVNNLKPGLIIGMGVLNRGDIDLLLSRQALKVEGTEIPLCYTPPPKRRTTYQLYHFMTNTNTLGFNRKHANSIHNALSPGIDYLGVHKKSPQCRRWKQHFSSGNTLHRHLPHCSKSTTGSKCAVHRIYRREGHYGSLLAFWMSSSRRKTRSTSTRTIAALTVRLALRRGARNSTRTKELRLIPLTALLSTPTNFMVYSLDFLEFWTHGPVS